MDIYQVTIRPDTAFGTPLKGDTLFGHFCWQAAEDEKLLDGGLDYWLDQYDEHPFAVFSSAWPLLGKGDRQAVAITRPLGKTPVSNTTLSRKEAVLGYKKDKKKKWLLLGPSLEVKLEQAYLKSDHGLFELFMEDCGRKTAAKLRLLDPEARKVCSNVTQFHNTINRQTFTTGMGLFAPFAHENFQFLPGLKLAVFVGVDGNALDGENLCKGMERIGFWGYGRDASAGLGRFTVTDVQKVVWPRANNADEGCWILAPAVPEKSRYHTCHALPFTRFGKHGATLATTANPFKNPVIMADEGGVLYPRDRDTFKRPYLGSAVRNVSKAEPRTVVQGYSLYLPC